MPKVDVYFLLLREDGVDTGDGELILPYDHRDVCYINSEDGTIPQWCIATKDVNNGTATYHTLSYNGTSWVKTDRSEDLCEDEAATSIFQKETITTGPDGLIKLTPSQIDNADLRSRVRVSDRMVVYSQAKRTAYVCKVVSALPMKFRPVGGNDDGTEDITYRAKHILIVGVPDDCDNFEYFDEERRSYIAAKVAELSAKPVMKVQAVAGAPQSNPPPPNPATKGSAPPPPGAAAKGAAREGGGGFGAPKAQKAPAYETGNTGRRVTYRYTNNGNEYTQTGAFVSDTHVMWDTDSSVTVFPPPWANCQEVSRTVHPPGDSDGDEAYHPGDQGEPEFDVFNDVTWLGPLFEYGPLQVITMARDELRSDPNARGPLVRNPRFEHAEKALRRFMTANLEALDPGNQQSQEFRDFRLQHMSYILAWAGMNGLDETVIANYISSKREGKKNVVRQGIEQGVKSRRGGGGGRGSGVSGRGRGRWRSGGGGTRYGQARRAPGPNYTGCHECGAYDHFANECTANRQRPPVPQATQQQPPRGQQGFRGGRGGLRN